MNKKTKLEKFFKKLTDNEIWDSYALAIRELKRRSLVRTRNIVGERGEFLAIETYNNTPGLPNLQAAPEGTQNVDALSRKGDRYSIKTITEPGKTTGVFYNCGDLGDKTKAEKRFEYVAIVVVDKDLRLKKILEITWKQFLELRKWHKTMKAWNIYLNKSLLKEAKIIYE